jgi:hypothetical protein
MYLKGDGVSVECEQIEGIWKLACQLEQQDGSDHVFATGVHVCAIMHLLLGLHISTVLPLGNVPDLIRQSAQFRRVMLTLLSDQQPVDINRAINDILSTSNVEDDVVVGVWKLSRSLHLEAAALPDRIEFLYALGPMDKPDKKYIHLLYIDSPGKPGHFALAIPVLELPGCVTWVIFVS